MRNYEVMLILPESLADDQIDKALKGFVKEVKALKGRCSSPSRMGRKIFARPQQKMNAGEYAICSMEIDQKSIKPLLAKLKFHEDIFRIMITVKTESKGNVPATPAEPAAAEA